MFGLKLRPPVGRRGGEDDAAGRLVDHILGHVADVVLERTHTAEQGTAADSARFLGGEHDRLDAATLGLADDRRTRAAGPHDRGRHLDALVFLAHDLRPHERLTRALDLSLRQRRVERQRQRDFEHPDRLDHRPLLDDVVPGLSREPARRLHDVVVERRAEDRNENRAELRLERLVPQRPFRDRDPPQQRLLFGLAVDDIERQPADEPADADPAGARVVDHDDHHAGRREHSPDQRRQRHLRSADGDRERDPVGPRAIGLPEAQRDHRNMGDHERDQRAERVDPHEQLDVAREHERGARQRGGADHDERRPPPRAQPSDRAGDLAIGRQRVADTGDAEHRCPCGGGEPERAADRRRRT